ncbi:hypothetical protein AMTRI_Chr12g238300 [Amborella trichopoda]
MAPLTPRLVVPVDPKRKPWEQKVPLHNRWHPLIPPVEEVREGELFRVEMLDWTGGNIGDNDSALDIKSIDLSTTRGIPAKPGDLLAIKICNLGPLPADEWGYTATLDRENGGGFLTDHFPCATKAIWYFEGIYAYSPHIPGVRFPGLTHPGIIGTAPSHELLNIWNEREKDLEVNGYKSFKLCDILHTRPLANLPTAKGCLLGKIEEGKPDWEKIASEAARTIRGREIGGNGDIKNLSRGSKVYLPMFVDGGNFSTGDMHFSQGDGEVSFCGAIEMSGFLELKCEIIRGEMQKYLTPMGPTPLHVNPIFEIGPVEPRFSEWLVFEGISVDESGKQHYLDATVAYKKVNFKSSCLGISLMALQIIPEFYRISLRDWVVNIDRLELYQIKLVKCCEILLNNQTKCQCYLLLSCCPCEGRISGIVDSPNAMATIAIPTSIFDQDIRPMRGEVPIGPRLVKKPDVLRCTYDGILPVTPNPAASTSSLPR